MIYQELDEAILRLHIQDVIFVNPGWDKQQGGRIDLLRCGRILDEFDQLIAVDHLAWCQGQVSPGLEGLGVGHLDLSGFEVT